MHALLFLDHLLRRPFPFLLWFRPQSPRFRFLLYKGLLLILWRLLLCGPFMPSGLFCGLAGGMVYHDQRRHDDEKREKSPHQAVGPEGGIATVHHGPGEADEDPDADNRTQVENEATNILHNGLGGEIRA